VCKYLDEKSSPRKEDMSTSEFIRKTSTLVSAQVIAQVIGLLSMPIVSRLYTKVAYGELAIVISVATILSSIIELGLNSAIMIPREIHEAKEVFSTSYLLQFGLVTIITIVIVAVKPQYQLFNIGVSYYVTCLLMYIYILLNNLSGLLRIYMNREGLYKALFWNSIIGALSTLCITIPLGLMGWGFMGFMTANLVSSFVCNAQMLWHANPFITVKFSRRVALLKEYKDFIIFQLPSNIIDTFSKQLPNQILATSFGSAALGGYSMSQKVLGIPSGLIASPISTVYFKTADEFHKEGKDLAKFTFSLISKTMLISLVPLVVLLAYGKEVFSFVLGEQWREAGIIASILGLQYVLMFCDTCTSYCRVSIGKQKVNFSMSIVKLTITIVSLSVGVVVYKNLIGTITCFAVGASCSYILDMGINFFCMKRYILKYFVFAISYCVIVFLLTSAIKLI